MAERKRMVLYVNILMRACLGVKVRALMADSANEVDIFGRGQCGRGCWIHRRTGIMLKPRSTDLSGSLLSHPRGRGPTALAPAVSALRR